MEQTVFINIGLLTLEARKELETFYEFLLFKYQHPNKVKRDSAEEKAKKFRHFADQHLINLPHNYKFNRGEAHER